MYSLTFQPNGQKFLPPLIRTLCVAKLFVEKLISRHGVQVQLLSDRVELPFFIFARRNL